MRVGFIGLGRMGRPMAHNLLRAGLALVVHSRGPGPVAELAAAGARAADRPRAVAEQADVVLTCLPGPAEVAEVYLGPEGILAGARPGLACFDHSTVGVETSRAVGQAAGARQVAFFDAPVSGGTTGAAAGTLTIMVGGDGWEPWLPVLRTMGQNIRGVGPVGAGSALKLVNQYLVGIYSRAIAEALVMGAGAGLDPRVMLEVLSTSFGNNGVLRRHLETYILPGDWDRPGFVLDLLHKDVRLAVELAEHLGVPAALGRVALGAIADAQAGGLGQCDMAGLIIPVEQAAGVAVRRPAG